MSDVPAFRARLLELDCNGRAKFAAMAFCGSNLERCQRCTQPVQNHAVLRMWYLHVQILHSVDQRTDNLLAICARIGRRDVVGIPIANPLHEAQDELLPTVKAVKFVEVTGIDYLHAPPPR